MCHAAVHGRGRQTFVRGQCGNIGFQDKHRAQIGVDRSKDGITDWQRHPSNPIIRPGKDKWDADAVYKPHAVFDGKRWLL
jgi:hypothetical protein